MRTNLLALAFLSVVAAPIATTDDASAQSYPTRPVRIILPYPAGGPGDVIARMLAQKLSERIGAQFYVENLAGAGGTIGAGTAARAAADGYTILMMNQDFIIQPLIKTKVPYDPFTSFTPIALVATAPEMISVHPSVRATSMKELLVLLKTNPGKYSYATPGYGTSPHLAGERLFRNSNGLDVVAVPFQGGGPAVQSTLAGHTQIIHIISPAVAPYLKDGTLRALAVASPTRSPAFPDVPTLAESGIPNHDVAHWNAVVVPAGTPAPIIERLRCELAAVMNSADVRQRLNAMGYEPLTSTPEELARHMRAETDAWRAVVRGANIKIE